MPQLDESSVPMQTTRIKRIIEENYRIKTFELSTFLPKAKPGQFAMVWVPNVGERPMSIGSGEPLSFTVAKVGPVSEALHSLKQGDLFSFRGPFGNWFELPERKTRNAKLLLVGGGYGVVPLSFLAEEAKKKKLNVTAIVAARNANEILLEGRLKKSCSKVIVATDDGSKGYKGNAVQAAKAEGPESFDCVFSCGPEKMMYYLALACREAKVQCQLSLERQIKCGMGICGSCAMDGKLVCRDGPVFSGEAALKIKDFGN